MSFDPNQTIDILRSLIIAVIGLALLFICAVALWTAGKKGDSGKAGRIVGASLIALVPGVIALGVGALAFASAVFGWVIPGFS